MIRCIYTKLSLRVGILLKASLGALTIAVGAASAPALSAESVAVPPEVEAPGTTLWQRISMSISERARALGVSVQSADDQAPLRLFVKTTIAFQGNGRDLTPDFADLLSQAAMLLQNFPDSRVTVVGYGNNPSTNYNPVQLGLRVRRIRTTLANEGVPYKQIRAVVKSHDYYDGPAELFGLAPNGKLIELRINPR